MYPSAIVADPGAVVPLAMAWFAYSAGRQRRKRRITSGRPSLAGTLSFAGGLTAAALALASPLEHRADTSLSAHMIQHVVLLTLAGPLIALGRPAPTLLWALPQVPRDRALGVYRRLRRAHDRNFAGWVATTLVVEAVVMWAWHLPDLYQGAVAHPALHALEHLSFLGASTAAWWSVASGPRSSRGAAAVAALLGSVPGMALGAALVLAPNPWYPMYATGSRAAALTDQQIAGVIMWAFGGMAAVIAGVGLFATWLRGAPGDLGPPVPPLPSARTHTTAGAGLR